MFRGIYLSASGLKSRQRRLDILANNIANISTPGFKADQPFMAAYDRAVLSRSLAEDTSPLGTLPRGVVAQSAIKFTQGPYEVTDRQLDIAFKNPQAFLRVMTSDGERFSRGGRLRLNAQNQLVDANGNPVLGQDGPIEFPEQTMQDDLRVDSSGRVRNENEVMDKLAVVTFQNTAVLSKDERGYFLAPAGVDYREGEGEILPGVRERSNVDLSRSMVDLLRVQRAYEANQRLLRGQDETLRLAANELGRV